MAEVSALFNEKKELTKSRKLKLQRIHLKEYLEQKLQETLQEIKLLEESESNSIQKITLLEPQTIKNEIIEFAELLDENERRIYSIHSGEAADGESNEENTENGDESNTAHPPVPKLLIDSHGQGQPKRTFSMEQPNPTTATTKKSPRSNSEKQPLSGSQTTRNPSTVGGVATTSSEEDDESVSSKKPRGRNRSGGSGSKKTTINTSGNLVVPSTENTGKASNVQIKAVPSMGSGTIQIITQGGGSTPQPSNDQPSHSSNKQSLKSSKLEILNKINNKIKKDDDTYKYIELNKIVNNVDEGVILFYENGVIKGGTINKLIEYLTNINYIEKDKEFSMIILFTFPAFINSSKFLSTLFQRFCLPTASLKSKSYQQSLTQQALSPKSSTGGESNRKSVGTHNQISPGRAVGTNIPIEYSNQLNKVKFKSDNLINDGILLEADQTRTKILEFIELWINNYWESDFSLSEYLIVKMVSFLDYIVDSLPGYQAKADPLRENILNRFNLLLKLQEEKNTIPPNASGSGTSVNKNLFDAIDSDEFLKYPSFAKKGITSLECIFDILFDIDVSDVAKQFCLIDKDNFNKIHSRELLRKSWITVDKEELSPSIVQLIERFNKLSQLVSTCILQRQKHKQRVKTIDWFINLAMKCKEMNNYFSLVAIIGGLQDPSVSRLHKTWEDINPKLQHSFSELIQIMDLRDNWSNYRKSLAHNISNKEPIIPYIGIYLKDLVVIEDTLPDYLSDANDKTIINVDKWRKLSAVISEIQTIQLVSYPFQRIGVICASLELALSMFALLDEQQRFEQSCIVEPQKKKKQSLPSSKK